MRVAGAHSAPTSAHSSTSVDLPAALGADASFAVGTAVAFSGLVSRAELEGLTGTVLSFDAGSLRYAVKVDSTGDCVRVLLKNLKPILLVAGLVT